MGNTIQTQAQKGINYHTIDDLMPNPQINQQLNADKTQLIDGVGKKATKVIPAIENRPTIEIFVSHSPPPCHPHPHWHRKFLEIRSSPRTPISENG